MSQLQNIWVSQCLDLYSVTQCLGGTMSGWHNVWVEKCLVVKMSGCQKVGCKKVQVAKYQVPKCRRIQNCGCPPLWNWALSRKLPIFVVMAFQN